jgi:hypothetical protein
MTKKTAANSKTTVKKPRGKPFQPGQSGNPAGRPKDGESWAAIVKEIGDMYPEDLLAFIPATNELGQMIRKLPPKVQMKYLVTARVFIALMFEPTSGLWNGLMDRAEGKVPDRVKLEGDLNVEGIEALLDKVYGSNDPGRQQT